MAKVANVELTDRQASIAAFIARTYSATGTGVGYREICKEFGFEKDGKPYPNAAKGHVDALIKRVQSCIYEVARCVNVRLFLASANAVVPRSLPILESGKTTL